MEDTSVKTIRMSSEEAITAHKKLKAFAALRGKSMGDAVAELVSAIDLEEEVNKQAK